MQDGTGRLATRVARSAIGMLNRLMPKRRKAVLAGFPDVEDSMLEIARHLLVRGDIKVVILTHDEPPQIVRDRLPVIWRRTRSPRGFYHYLTARFVFFTHGLYLSPRPPRSQTCVNVWHGMPIKRIGNLLGRTPPPSTFVLATSEMFQSLVAQCFGVAKGEVLITGLPRNDVLVRATRRSGEIKGAIGLANGRKPPRLITWLPTYRQSVRGVIRTDGVVNRSIFGMDDIDMVDFEAFLAANDCVCIVKAHPMAAEYANAASADVVRIWNDQDLLDCGTTLYELVGASDMLITDASSVYVDFMLVNKPVIIAFPDLEEYRQTRGFAADPVEDFFAGPVVASFAELKAAIGNALLADSYEAARAGITRSFHMHADDQATARLLDRVIGLQGRSPAI